MSSTRTIERVQRLKLADSVAEQLERLILEGQYSVGDKLPTERALAEEFGVGRSSMREALRTVESSGLLRTDHGVGVFVVSNTKKVFGPADMYLDEDYTVPDLFEVRLALEREAAGLAAKRITEEESSRLQDILQRAGNPAISDDEFIRLDGELHRGISGASRNPLLLHLSESIAPLFDTYSHRVIRLPGRRAAAHAGHTLIIEAVTAGRVRDARTAVVNHLREVERDIIEFLNEKEPAKH